MLNTPVSTSSPRADVLPQHVAIIMDGNNRYAVREQLASGGGHLAGKESLDLIVEHARRIGIQVLTVFAFSSENWKRSDAEVSLLMALFKQAIQEQLPRMLKYKIAMRFIGDQTRLSPEIRQMMRDAEAQTAQFTEMTLVIAMSYGGQWDIVQATKAVTEKVLAGELRLDQIDDVELGKYTALSDLAPVDLLIRTGDELRISNFLLWQCAYAEFYFSPKLWPEFTPLDFDEAMADFATRQRRFGGSN